MVPCSNAKLTGRWCSTLLCILPYQGMRNETTFEPHILANIPDTFPGSSCKMAHSYPTNSPHPQSLLGKVVHSQHYRV
jgi:hypothetical protein